MYSEILHVQQKQARKPRSYASSQLSPSHLLTGWSLDCRATGVAKNTLKVLAQIQNLKYAKNGE